MLPAMRRCSATPLRRALSPVHNHLHVRLLTSSSTSSSATAASGEALAHSKEGSSSSSSSAIPFFPWHLDRFLPSPVSRSHDLGFGKVLSFLLSPWRFSVHHKLITTNVGLAVNNEFALERALSLPPDSLPWADDESAQESEAEGQPLPLEDLRLKLLVYATHGINPVTQDRIEIGEVYMSKIFPVAAAAAFEQAVEEGGIFRRSAAGSEPNRMLRMIDERLSRLYDRSRLELKSDVDSTIPPPATGATTTTTATTSAENNPAVYLHHKLHGIIDCSLVDSRVTIGLSRYNIDNVNACNVTPESSRKTSGADKARPPEANRVVGIGPEEMGGGGESYLSSTAKDEADFYINKYSLECSSFFGVKAFMPSFDPDVEFSNIMNGGPMPRGMKGDVITMQVDVRIITSGEEFGYVSPLVPPEVLAKALEEMRGKPEFKESGCEVIIGADGKLTVIGAPAASGTDGGSKAESTEDLQKSLDKAMKEGAVIKFLPYSGHLVTFECEMLRDTRFDRRRRVHMDSWRWKIIDIDGVLDGNSIA